MGLCVCMHSLEGNELGSADAAAIAEALKVNALLKKLDVRYNSILGGAGEQALRDAVKGRAGFELLL